MLEIFQIFKRPLYKSVLGHIQMGIDFHSGSDTGMSDRFGEGSQVEVGIIFMLDVVMGHIGVAKTMDSDIVG